ncbi:hypothetical protein [Actinoplanes regularis]|uniref:hypothetical protein n=1 Tax=Actinoplanes regularis TaxID=52697 RepID=UPI002554D07B|nr:hypothetical protein [Actinoplanes regularis]GLW27686.1 hypothetical protein Areg01_06260 [Actinoplanes regularis]
MKINKSAAAAVAVAGLLLAGCQPAEKDRVGAAPSASVSAAPIGNGIPALGAAEILNRASTQVKAAKTYRVSGNVTSEGATIEFDMTVAGKDKTGTMTMGGAKIELLVVDGVEYGRMDKKFWTSMLGPELGKKMAAQMKGRWIKSPKGKANPATEWFDAVDIDKMLDEEAASSSLTKGALTEFNGTPVIILTDEDSGASLYVATTGQPYLLKVGDIGGSRMVFSDFDKEFPEIKAPAPSQVMEAPTNNKKA